MRTDGIIFDLDGTLWDSCRVVAESWAQTMRRIYVEAKCPTEEDIKSIMGLTATEIADRLFSDFRDREMEVCKRCMEEEIDYISEHSGDVYPGVEEMLRKLGESYPLFIVSNCQDGYIQCFFKGTGFGKYIKDFECEGVTGMAKAENIRLVCERNGLSCAVYVGDTAGDERSAKAAGCRFVHARYGFGEAKAPDAVIDSPAELLAVISAMEE